MVTERKMSVHKLLWSFVLLWPMAAHASETHKEHSPTMNHAAPAVLPTQPGQSAFAAIQEIVEMLDADPATDWSRVDIDALRAHLVDMSNVTLYASVTTVPVPNGIRYDIDGDGAVRESIRRMTVAHVKTMSGVGGLTLTAEGTETGARMTAVADDAGGVVKLRGLGFFGLLTLGMHHQAHHLALASGRNPHAH